MTDTIFLCQTIIKYFHNCTHIQILTREIFNLTDRMQITNWDTVGWACKIFFILRAQRSSLLSFALIVFSMRDYYFFLFLKKVWEGEKSSIYFKSLISRIYLVSLNGDLNEFQVHEHTLEISAFSYFFGDISRTWDFWAAWPTARCLHTIVTQGVNL